MLFDTPYVLIHCTCTCFILNTHNKVNTHSHTLTHTHTPGVQQSGLCGYSCQQGQRSWPAAFQDTAVHSLVLLI